MRKKTIEVKRELNVLGRHVDCVSKPTQHEVMEKVCENMSDGERYIKHFVVSETETNDRKPAFFVEPGDLPLRNVIYKAEIYYERSE